MHNQRHPYNVSNKILPLTLKQLKQAQIHLKTHKQKRYEHTVYQFICVVARVLKVDLYDITLTDESLIIKIDMYSNVMKQSAQLITGRYYRFFFEAKKQILNGSLYAGKGQLFGFQIIGIDKVRPNQITKHIVSCLSEKLRRQQLHSNKIDAINSKQNNLNNTNMMSKKIEGVKIQSSEMITGVQKVHNQALTTVMIILPTNTAYEQISEQCRRLNDNIEMDMLMDKFGKKYTQKQIEKVIQILSEKGLIMDLGLAYQWVHREEQANSI